MSDHYIDLQDVVRFNRHIQEQLPIKECTRLLEGIPEQNEASTVSWEISGRQKAHGPALISLKVKANPLLQCQRCMNLFHYEVDTEVELEVVSSLKAFDRDVADSGEINNEAYEKILANKPINIKELVEDELMLSLPYIPKHEVCPDLVVLPEDNLEKKPSPFAILKKLK